MPSYKSETKRAYNTYPKSFAGKFVDYAVKLDNLKGIVDEFLKSIPKNGRILDIGAGSGNYASYFKRLGYEVYCVDLSEKMAEMSKKRGLTTILMDFEHLGFKKNSLDGVWAYASLFHAPKANLNSILEQINEITKPNGTVYAAFKKGKDEGFRVQAKYSGTKRWFSLYSDKELRKYFGLFKINTFSEIDADGNIFLHYIMKNEDSLESRTNQLLSFLKEIEEYKTIEREVYTSNPARAESNAEHSWHLAMFLLLFEKDLPKGLNHKKMLKLALMHDLVEIYAGDTFAFDKLARNTKRQRETKAAERLFSQLPDDLNKEFTRLFNEYEAAETKEAKTVKSFDKIQPILQNLCSQGKSWKKHNLTYKDIDDYKRRFMTHDGLIFSIYNKLLEEARARNLIK